MMLVHNAVRSHVERAVYKPGDVAESNWNLISRYLDRNNLGFPFDERTPIFGIAFVVFQEIRYRG